MPGGKDMSENKCPHCKTKDRSEDEIKDLITRLNRIEGQIRGIRKMIEEDAYCVDIITQVSAAKCSLNSFSKVVLGNHIKTCVADDIRNGSDEKTEELVELLQKLMK
jgi:DNA-binding FrmR family transcriptional regulator